MKRVLVVLALSLLLAAPTHAQTGKYVGTWLVGADGPDWIKVLRLRVRDDHNVGWGTSVGKGYLPFLQVQRTTRATLFATVSGTWEDSTECVALFALGQAGCLAPPVGTPYYEYHAMLVMQKTGMYGYLAADDQRQRFRFRVERWP
jgi:hypothetical protein